MAVLSIIMMLFCASIVLVLAMLVVCMIVVIINAPNVPGHALTYVDTFARLAIAFAAMVALMHWW